MFKIYKAGVEKETSKSLKCLRSDRGGEYTSQEFTHYCKEQKIKRQLSATRTPQQNGVVERKNRTLIDCARTLMIQNDLPHHFWREAINTTV